MSRDKMYESNSKARRWLLENGFNDIHMFPHTRFSKDVHFQGLPFDGCASYGKRFSLFQIKTRCNPTKKQQEQMNIASKESGVILIWFSFGRKNETQIFKYFG